MNEQLEAPIYKFRVLYVLRQYYDENCSDTTILQVIFKLEFQIGIKTTDFLFKNWFLVKIWAQRHRAPR